MAKQPKKGAPKTRAKLGVGHRQPRTVAARPEDGTDQPKFSFRYADLPGRWWPQQHETAEILSFLCEMSRLTWQQIKAQTTDGRKKHHYQPLDSVSPEAQRRFTELRLEGIFEEYFRFRLGGRKRLWGFLVDGVFYPLWWDAHHAVYPVTKRHT